ncbi:S-layer protein domain-containing protein [Methanolobus halotolerans]|nr:S-layer protein domain-containing protein [Methanolobus halotolerans]
MEKSSQAHKKIIIYLLAVILLLSALPPATCAENEILLNGTGIFLTTGESWSFDQGYYLKIKSVNQGTNKAWVELSLNGEVIREGILSEGETLVYSRNGEILNITLDTIYSSPQGELLTFKPVYQYIDSEIPEPEIKDKTENHQSDDNTSDSRLDGNNRSIPGFGTFLALVVITIVTYCLDKRAKKK